jgi:hypothetical protein
MQDIKNHYNVLGVSRDAQDEDIKRAFRLLSHRYHPDKNPGNKVSEEKFKEAFEAYDVLSNEQKRQELDLQLSHFETHFLAGLDGLNNVISGILRGDIKPGSVYVEKTVVVDGVVVSHSKSYEKETSEQMFRKTIKAYDGINLSIKSEGGNLYLELNQSDYIQFDGTGNVTYDSNDGININGFNGIVSLPKDLDIDLSIAIKDGSLEGNLAHESDIKPTRTKVNLGLEGEISLGLNNFYSKGINVENMYIDDDLYYPNKLGPNDKIKRTVDISTIQCDPVNITYKE